MSVPPRAYDASDLVSLKRNDLINLVKSQQDRWPVKICLNSHVNKTQIRNVLLDPQYGFTTTHPPIEQFDAWDLASNPFAMSTLFLACMTSFLTLSQTLLAQPQAQGSLVLPAVPLPPPAPPRPLDDTEFDLVLPEDGRPVSRNLHVFLEDSRPGMMAKTSTNITVDVESFFDGNPGQGVWSVSTKSVVMKIQASRSRLVGPGALRIGIPDAMDNSFTEFFVEAPAAQLASADMNPSILLIRDTINPSITLRVSGQQV